MAFQIVRNDITKMRTEAIVNTANEQVAVGPGCDYAVYMAAGYDELFAYRKERVGVVPEGEVFLTPGFGLPARYIIHAVSPLYKSGTEGEEEKLRSCYRNSLLLAKENGIKSIAFPLIATGSFGYPKEEGMRIAVDEIHAFLLSNEMDVYLVVFSEKATAMGQRLWPKLEEYIDRHYVEEKFREEYEDTERDRARRFRLLEESRRREEFRHESVQADRERSSVPKSFDRPTASRRSASKSSDESDDLKSFFHPEISRPIADSLSSKPSGNAAALQPASGHVPSASKVPGGSIFKKESEPQIESCCEMEPESQEDESCFGSKHVKRLEERIRHLSDTFSQYLIFLIQNKGMKNADVYRRAIVDKKTFSKIKNNTDYHPQKRTAMCLCVGAKLNLDESKDLLSRAGYALSPSDMTDVIFRYFIENGIYDMIELDLQLEEHGLPCIIE